MPNGSFILLPDNCVPEVGTFYVPDNCVREVGTFYEEEHVRRLSDPARDNRPIIECDASTLTYAALHIYPAQWPDPRTEPRSVTVSVALAGWFCGRPTAAGGGGTRSESGCPRQLASQARSEGR